MLSISTRVFSYIARLFGFHAAPASDDLAADAETEPTPATPTSNPERDRLLALFKHAKLTADAVAPTRTVRFIDHAGAVVWLNGLSPQDAQDRLAELEDLGLEVLGVVDYTALPRKPIWPVEYEDPQCYCDDVIPRDDPSNFNLGTAELRTELIGAGHSPAAVVRATSAGFTSPTIYVH